MRQGEGDEPDGSLVPGPGARELGRTIYNIKEFRLYIKQDFSTYVCLTHF
jgi:hypothetical protein